MLHVEEAYARLPLHLQQCISYVKLVLLNLCEYIVKLARCTFPFKEKSPIMFCWYAVFCLLVTWQAVLYLGSLAKYSYIYSNYDVIC